MLAGCFFWANQAVYFHSHYSYEYLIRIFNLDGLVIVFFAFMVIQPALVDSIIGTSANKVRNNAFVYFVMNKFYSVILYWAFYSMPHLRTESVHNASELIVPVFYLSVFSAIVNGFFYYKWPNRK